MALQTSPFSGWRLSGKEAEAFLEQVNQAQSNPLAQASLDRGRQLMAEYDQKGYVTLHSYTIYRVSSELEPIEEILEKSGLK